MMNEFGSSLLLARVQHEDTVAVASASLARPQDSNPGHLLLVDGHGTLYQTQLPTSVLTGQGSLSQVSVNARFELFLANQDDPIPVQRSWSCFARQDDGLIFAHVGSCNLLFVPLPANVGECAATFLFGKQSGAVTCLASHGHTLISGGRDGGVCMWDTATGQKLDTHQPPLSAGAVTAVAFIGPLMGCSGDEFGCVTIFDISGRVLMPVSRFFADDGPVSHMAAAVPFACQLNIGSACAPRPPDGGGVMQPPVALPRRRLKAGGDDDNQGTSTGALLAVASTAGWLHVFQPNSSGNTRTHNNNLIDPTNGWQEAYSGSLPGLPCGLEFAKEGEYLVVATDLQFGGKIMVLHTRSWAAAAELNTPHHLASAGLLHPAGQLAVFPETLEPALQLDVYLVPHNGLPTKQQVKLPFKRAADQIIAINVSAAGPSQSNTSQGNATKTVIDEGFHGFQAGENDTDSAPSPHKQAASVLSRSTLSFRPSTLPVGRSWLGGGQPQIDLDDVLSASIPAHSQPGGPQEALRNDSHNQQAAYDEQPVGRVHQEQHVEDQDRPVNDVVTLQADYEQHITAKPPLQGRDASQGQGLTLPMDMTHVVHAITESSSYVEQQQQQDGSSAHQDTTGDVGFDEELQPRTIPAHLTPTTRRTVSHTMYMPQMTAEHQDDLLQHQQQQQQQQQQGPHELQSGNRLLIPEEQYAKENATDNIEQSLNELTLRPEQSLPRQTINDEPMNTMQQADEVQGDDASDQAPDHNEFLATQYFGSTLDRYNDASYSHDLQPDDQNLDYMAEPLDGQQHDCDHHTMDQQLPQPVSEWQDTESFPDYVSTVPMRSQLQDNQQQVEAAKTKPSSSANASKSAAHVGASAGLRGELHSRRRALHNVKGGVTHRIQVGHTDDRQLSQADGDTETAPRPQPLPRSPYRGYKPSMAVLLKELRAKNRATRQATAAIHKQTHQQRYGVNDGLGSAVDTVAHDQSLQQQGMQEVVTPRGRDDVAAYLNQQSQQQQLTRRSVGTSHIASPMLMGSPIASEAARSRAFDNQEGVLDDRQPAHEIIPHAAQNALAAWQSGPPGNEGQLETDAAGLLKYCQLNSTLHLVSRMEALAKGDVGIPALSPHEQAEAIRRAAAITANVPQHVNLYSNLPPLAPLPPPPKPVKQLDPRWVASRNVKPEISMLWDAQEQQQEVVSSKGVAVYTRPTPQALAQDVLLNATTMRISW